MSGDSSSSGSSSAQGSQPKQGAGEPQSRERTPDAPGAKPESQDGQDPQPKGEKPDDRDGQDPRGNKESKDQPRNEKGGPPPAQETSRAAGDRSNERWGELPETVRDLFRTEGGGDLPPEYRDWIDAYYRRLNRERR